MSSSKTAASRNRKSKSPTNNTQTTSSSSNNANNSSNFVEHLQMLRSVVDGIDSIYTETDLSTCLRESGYDVNLAAEHLLTQQYQPRSKRIKPNSGSSIGGFFGNRHKNAAASKSQSPSPSNTTKNTASRSSSSTNTAHKGSSSTPTLKKPPPSSTTSASSTTETKSSIHNRKPAPAVITPKTPMVRSTISSETSPTSSSLDYKSTSWLLCQRWVSDGVNTQRNSTMLYNEQLNIEIGGNGIQNSLLKFRGKSTTGQLPKKLNQFLYPLVSKKLIEIHAFCLMEQRHLPIGAQVPLSLRITIPDPHAFFAVFSNHQATTNNKLFWKEQQQQGSSSKSRSFSGSGSGREEALPFAAFQLLQWSQYGEEMPKFETVSDDDDDDDMLKICKSDDEEREEERLLLEAPEEDEANDARMASITTSSEAGAEEEKSSSLLPEQKEPPGFKASLRPYQRQALYWMIQRENKDEAEEWSNQRLQLLRDLQSSTSSSTNKDNTNGPDGIVVIGSINSSKAIHCDTCGPVHVNLVRTNAPPISEAIHNEHHNHSDQEQPINHDHHHPLWERRYLASSNGQYAISFYVQPMLGLASPSRPPPPQPCRGGILADSMGLGKTVEMLALIQHSPKGASTLIVTPLSLLNQWEEELTSKTNLSYFVYYGDNKKKKNGVASASSIADSVQVVLTTYGSLQAELVSHTRKQSKKQRRQNSGNVNNDSSSLFLLEQHWTRVILDEAHSIKNTSTATSKACCLLKAERRWCVSGTILQNSLDDVFGLLKFLKHEPWCEASFWKAAIANAQEQNSNDDGDSEQSDEKNARLGNEGQGIALDRVRRVLLPLLLRRTKDSLDKDGKPILTLPPKEIKTIMVDFSLAERHFYDALHKKSLDVFQGFLRAGTASKSWLTIFSLLHRLRQTCDHVALTIKAHQDPGEWDSNIQNMVGDDVAAKSGLHPFDTDKNTKVAASAKPSDTIDQKFLEDLLKRFKAMDSSESKEKSKGDDLTNGEVSYASNVAKMLNEAVQNQSTALDEECSICLDPINIRESVVTPCFHVFCKDCLVGVLKNRNNRVQKCPNGPCPVCNNEIDSSKILCISDSDDGAIRTKYLVSTPQKNMPARKDLSIEQEEAAEDGAARQVLETAVQGSGSAKLTAIIEELHNVWEEDPGSKVIIFSQFLGFLDLIGQSCRANRILTSRLDGSLSLKERMAVLKTFAKSKENPSSSVGVHTSNRNDRIGSVLLISMKAGGVGLNLVAASTVFIVDPWWNAAVEDQCVDRIHRIGQRARKVRIRKFCVRGSVEERILELQKRKKEIASRVLCDKGSMVGSDGKNESRPTMDDLKILFAA